MRPTVEEAKKAIEEGLAVSELLGDPTYDEVSGNWRGLVALSPWGPLVIMEFGLVPTGLVSCE